MIGEHLIPDLVLPNPAARAVRVVYNAAMIASTLGGIAGTILGGRDGERAAGLFLVAIGLVVVQLVF